MLVAKTMIPRGRASKRLALVQQLFARNLIAPDFLTGHPQKTANNSSMNILKESRAIGYIDVVAAADAIVTNRRCEYGNGLRPTVLNSTGVFGALFSIGS